MSVVNRMLLDIDRRNGAADVQTQGPYPDIRSVPTAAKPPARNSLAVIVLIGVAVGVAAVVVNYAAVLRGADTPAAKVAVPVVAARAAPPALVSLPPLTPLPQPDVSAPVPAVVAMSPPALDTSAVVATSKEAPPVVVTRKETPPKVSQPRATPAVIESFKLSRQLSPVEERPASFAPQPVAPVSRVATAAPAKTTPPLREVAAGETVAAARVLWNEGSRAGALATLREALALAEARNPAAVAPLARELARLEVADNRPQAAVDLLRRVEEALAGDAEAWALRGNAEQRVGLHGDSARSYLAALRMRPAEGRWMLGAAISLAADGKLDEANAWSERARELGAVTPAMEAYLQQLGVAARR